MDAGGKALAFNTHTKTAADVHGCVSFRTGGISQATVITFGTGGTSGFTGGGSSDGPVNVGGGIALTVTPWSNSFIFDPTLTVDGNGYGVRSGIIDDDQLDGSGWTEGDYPDVLERGADQWSRTAELLRG